MTDILLILVLKERWILELILVSLRWLVPSEVQSSHFLLSFGLFLFKFLFISGVSLGLFLLSLFHEVLGLELLKDILVM